MRHTHELEVFVEAYRLRSFASAATALNATQSGISQCIKRLESDIGARLFDRRNNTIEPTAAGKEFYEHCQRFLIEHRSLIGRIRQESVPRKRLTIGVNAWMARFIVPSAIDKFSREFPNVELTVIEAASRVLADLVARGQIAMAIASTQALGDGPNLFMRTPGVLISRKTIDLAAPGLKVNLIVPSPSDPNREIIDRYVAQGLLDVAKRLELDSLSAAFSLIRASDWSMILPQIVYLSDPEKSSLSVTSLASAPEFKLSIIYNEVMRSEEVDIFEKLMRREVDLSMRS